MDLRTELKNRGVDATGMDDATVRKVAQALGVKLPRQVEIVDYKGAKYVKTENFEVPGREAGKQGTARNIFLRVEAIDQAILDLTAAKGLVK